MEGKTFDSSCHAKCAGYNRKPIYRSDLLNAIDGLEDLPLGNAAATTSYKAVMYYMFKGPCSSPSVRSP